MARKGWLACAGTAFAASLALGGAAHAQAPVKVGVVEGLSGPPAIVDFGESYLQGIKLALEDYKANGGKTPIELVIYDDEANPQRAVSVVQRLIQNDGVVGVIGTVSSGNVMAFAPLLQRAGVPLIAGPSAATDITAKFIDQKPSYIFRCSMIEKYQIDAIINWAVKNFKKIGLLHSTTGYGNFAAQEATAGLKARGVELAAVEAAAPGVNDLTPQMIKMRDAGVDLILHFHESFELPYRPLPRLDYKPTFAGNWGLSSLKVKDIVGVDAIQGTAMGQALDLSNPKAKAFNTRMTEKYGKEYRWPVVAALGYDAGQIMFKAVDQVGKSDPAKLREAIENIDGIVAVSATPPKPFGANDHECLGQDDIFLGIWKGDTVVPAPK
ncbi:ABC transporter substrate-binding protein [Xanthobacter dioxanivorans]|uniref:ABC transporter substrate-binding protein n=1 Tax=Xanthobacter dioxanivorans TaxID=2528964 RepID=A0A974SKY5_9HYPH|nr:ABC transporter substrate-binding protein [Xanthobacter dioxanivorans]QRG09325.1 ABC transporter substrate-binding protein [Xanthobacter dioxanivorans]